MVALARKALGQHWLTDTQSLQAIVATADIKTGDHVLEIGPGLGHLTDHLLASDAKITALEYDQQLVTKLQAKYSGNHQIIIRHGDIRSYDFTSLPEGYKICANIPYYLTANLFRQLTETANKPQLASLLVQQEVAERLVSSSRLSLLSVFVKAFYTPELGPVVEARFFSPAPKVSSQVIKLVACQPVVEAKLWSAFSRLVKVGFANPRKQLYHNLAAGLQLPKEVVKDWLLAEDIDFKLRAQKLSVADWRQLTLSLPSVV